MRRVVTFMAMVLSLALVGLVRVVGATPVVYLSPDSLTVSPGETFTVSVYMDDASEITGMGVDLYFPSTALEFVDAEIPDDYGTGWFVANYFCSTLDGIRHCDPHPDYGDRVVLVGNTMGFYYLSGDGILLGSVTFRALEAGSFALGLDEAYSELDTYTGFKDSSGHNLDGDVTFYGGTLQVVPLPSALLLLGSGLLGLAGLRRRQAA